jgi:hypothetical protein
MACSPATRSRKPNLAAFTVSMDSRLLGVTGTGVGHIHELRPIHILLGWRVPTRRAGSTASVLGAVVLYSYPKGTQVSSRFAPSQPLSTVILTLRPGDRNRGPKESNVDQGGPVWSTLCCAVLYSTVHDNSLSLGTVPYRTAYRRPPVLYCTVLYCTVRHPPTSSWLRTGSQRDGPASHAPGPSRPRAFLPRLCDFFVL